MVRIVVADDDRDARELFSEILQFDGHQVLLARDGVEAERLVREQTPDIALIDIFMPGLDGLELIRRLRTQRPSVRIIAISAGWRQTSSPEAPDVLADARQLGAHATLRKPIKPVDLIDAVRRLLPAAGRGASTLFIVSRDHRDLFESCRRTFALNDTVEVVLDRRLAQRRQRNEPPQTDRRLRDRRSRPEVDAYLRSRGFAVVSLPIEIWKSRGS